MRASAPCTLRVCGRKNYRLQDIQLSKIIRGSAPNPGSQLSRCGKPVNFSKTVEPESRGGVFGPPPRKGPRQSHACKQSGEYRARTGDLLVANQALSQLS